MPAAPLQLSSIWCSDMHSPEKAETRMRTLSIAASLIIMALSGTASAQKYAGEFMALGGGARAMGMGGTFIAVANDATTTYWNPAGLADISAFGTSPEAWELSLMRSERFGDLIDYNYGSVVFPLRPGHSGWGISLMHMGIDDIRIVPFSQEMIGNSDGDDRFEPWNGESLNFDYRDYPLESVNDYALLFTYGQVMRFGHAGASLKLIRNDQVTGVSSFGIGIDLGYLRKGLWRDLAVGIKLQDATGTFISWSTGEREYIYPALKAGLAMPLRFNSMHSVLTLAVDGDFRFENRQRSSQFWIGRTSADLHIGAELMIRDIVALRGGLDMGRPTAGAGFLLDRFGPWNITLGIDYALLVHDVLDTTHRVSLLVSH